MATKTTLVLIVAVFLVNTCSATLCLEVINQYKAPMFQFNISLPIYPGHVSLITYMEDAVSKNQGMNSFTVRFSRPYGYFITSVNGVEANYNVDQSYWSLMDGMTNGFLPVGVSTYTPKIGDYIQIKLTGSGSHN